MKDILDPRIINQVDLPFHFVLSNQTTSLIAWAINWKTNANYDHIMQSINTGKFVTQDFSGYHEVLMGGYMIKGGRLKFVKIIGASETFNIAFRSVILNRLVLPWYKKIYDYGNILGRAFGLNWIHLPGTYDCSEASLWVVRKCLAYLPKPTQDVILRISPQASPDDIDMAIKNNPSVFTVYGEWSADDGVVVR